AADRACQCDPGRRPRPRESGLRSICQVHRAIDGHLVDHCSRYAPRWRGRVNARPPGRSRRSSAQEGAIGCLVASEGHLLAKGQTFIERVWERPRSPILASASDADGKPHLASAAGLEAWIETANGRRVVHVRAGGRDVAAATFNDDGAALQFDRRVDREAGLLVALSAGSRDALYGWGPTAAPS